MIAGAINHCYHIFMKAKHGKILTDIFKDPVNGNMEWSKIEALFLALGCRVVEGAGSKAALRYRIKQAREFLIKLGEKP